MANWSKILIHLKLCKRKCRAIYISGHGGSVSFGWWLTFTFDDPVLSSRSEVNTSPGISLSSTTTVIPSPPPPPVSLTSEIVGTDAFLQLSLPCESFDRFRFLLAISSLTDPDDILPWPWPELLFDVPLLVNVPFLGSDIVMAESEGRLSSGVESTHPQKTRIRSGSVCLVIKFKQLVN